MAKARSRRCRIPSRRMRARARPYKLPSSNRRVSRNMFNKDCPKFLEKRDWENVICSVCMECPHNAVLLLCSSHDKGCRPYMCGTSFRYSNCLDQFKKASGKLKSPTQVINKLEVGNLTCPLCRGQVKGWTIVQPARDDLNLKQRICMQENCVFAGTFKELRKHMKTDHPCAKPREVDPEVEQNWRRLEIEHAEDDVMSTIRSTMSGSTVFGDYVIETHGSDAEEGDDRVFNAALGRGLVNVFLLLNAIEASRDQGSGGYSPVGRVTRRLLGSNDLAMNRAVRVTITSGEEEGEVEEQEQVEEQEEGEEEQEEMHSNSLVSRMRRQGLVLLGRSGRRRRNREANQNTGPP